MAKIERQLRADAQKLVDYLHDGIYNSGMSVELVESAARRYGDVTVWLYVYDKYYMRNSSRASLTLQVVSDGEDVRITAIGSGGGSGSIFNFDYGAGDNFVNVVADLVDRYES